MDSWDHAGPDSPSGIVPFRQAWDLLAPDRVQGQERLKRELDELRKRLRFEQTRDSPRRGFIPTTLRDAH